MDRRTPVDQGVLVARQPLLARHAVHLRRLRHASGLQHDRRVPRIRPDGSTNTEPQDNIATPVEVPQAASAPTPIEFFNATEGSGLGNFTLTPSVSVVVPANAYNGYYTSVVTLAIVSGP